MILRLELSAQTNHHLRLSHIFFIRNVLLSQEGSETYPELQMLVSSNLKPLEPLTPRLTNQLSEVVEDLLVQLISLSVRIAVII